MDKMEFKDSEEKRRFAQTLISKGLKQARQEYVKNKYPVIVFPHNVNKKEIMGETLTPDQAQEKYPDIPVYDIKHVFVNPNGTIENEHELSE
jgi:hypothetical protein